MFKPVQNRLGVTTASTSHIKTTKHERRVAGTTLESPIDDGLRGRRAFDSGRQRVESSQERPPRNGALPTADRGAGEYGESSRPGDASGGSWGQNQAEAFAPADQNDQVYGNQYVAQELPSQRDLNYFDGAPAGNFLIGVLANKVGADPRSISIREAKAYNASQRIESLRLGGVTVETLPGQTSDQAYAAFKNSLHMGDGRRSKLHWQAKSKIQPLEDARVKRGVMEELLGFSPSTLIHMFGRRT